MAFIKWMDDRSRLVKILFSLPVIGVIWGVYRILGCFLHGKVNVLRLVLAIIWTMWAGMVGWVLDLVAIVLTNHIFWFKD
ncbi:MAG: hypothetical protein SO176_02630 [Bacilli bacterium]|nr:hypothetical protein [Bacilli bacterium]